MSMAFGFIYLLMKDIFFLSITAFIPECSQKRAVWLFFLFLNSTNIGKPFDKYLIA